MKRIIITIFFILTTIFSTAYASDDWSNLSKSQLSFFVEDKCGSNEVTQQTSSNKVGYISLPHTPNEKDISNCIVDNFTVELADNEQVHLLFEDNVDSALVRIKDTGYFESNVIVEEHLKKAGENNKFIEFTTNKKLTVGKYDFEVHSFVNNIPSDKKMQYYLWLKIEQANDTASSNVHTISKNFQVWLKKFLDKIKGLLLHPISLIRSYFSGHSYEGGK